MRSLALFLTLCLASPCALVAAPDETPLRAAADREARRAAASVARWQPDRPAENDAGWISRHPVLVGALVGAGAGTVASLVMENELFCSRGDEDCLFHGGSRALVGAGMGAGVGALVGWVVGAARNERTDRKTIDPRVPPGRNRGNQQALD